MDQVFDQFKRRMKSLHVVAAFYGVAGLLALFLLDSHHVMGYVYFTGMTLIGVALAAAEAVAGSGRQRSAHREERTAGSRPMNYLGPLIAPVVGTGFWVGVLYLGRLGVRSARRHPHSRLARFLLTPVSAAHGTAAPAGHPPRSPQASQHGRPES